MIPGVSLVPGGAEIAARAAPARNLTVVWRDREVALTPRGDWQVALLPDAAPGDRYHLVVDGSGPILDPYARAVDGAGVGMIVADTPPMPRGPRVPWAETVIYEAHVRGLTMRHPDVPEALRGTYAALAHPAVLAHLRDLGVTTLELLPVAFRVSEPFLAPMRLSNYWGYAPAAFLAPDPRFAATDDPAAELRAAIKAVHDAGLEVVLDVVFNHVSVATFRAWRRLDPAWFRTPDVTGTGNTLDLRHPAMGDLVLAALHHWATVYRVDGFRFDLAATLVRETDFLERVAAEPALADLKLIAEPWDAAPDGYRLGRFPAPWAEWNDRFRDTVRRFWRGDAGQLADLATRFAGSRDVFGGRAPAASVNHVAAHDGYTLADVVTYTERHNHANGECNRDGHRDNWSWNHGVEGPSDDAAIAAARRQDVANMLATTLLAAGTPMLTCGDELGRTQRGNNNAWCQDNDLSWLDWSTADTDLAAFVRDLLALRHAAPSFGSPVELRWLRPNGEEMDGPDWADPGRQALAVVLDGRFAVAMNASGAAITFALPAGRWERRLATAPGDGFVVTARSLVVFELEGEPRKSP